MFELKSVSPSSLFSFLPVSVEHDSAHFTGQGMPDVTGGQPPQLGAVGGAAPPPQEPQVSVGQVGKAPDILRTEPPLGTGSGLPASGPPSLVPSSDRNLFMETGELAEEDVARVSGGQQQQPPPPPMASNFVAPPPSVSSGPASLPPMVGGNEQHSGVHRNSSPALSPTFCKVCSK